MGYVEYYVQMVMHAGERWTLHQILMLAALVALVITFTLTISGKQRS